jgi:hypothetical protein
MTEKEAINIAGLAQALRGGAGVAARALGGAAKAAPGAVAGAAKNVAAVPGNIGNFALNAARRGVNVAGMGVDKLTRNGILPEFPPAVNKTLWNMAETARGAGTKTVGALQRGVERATGMAHTNAFNPLNVGVGAGIMGAGARALGGAAGAARPAAPSASAVPAAANPAQAFGAQAAGGFSGMSQRAQQMWGALPTEAKWAIGAGVPLALLGGYMGRKGGLGGLGLGALGLGAAALGGASGGVFGDDARRFSGKMLYNLGSFFGGGGDDHASQLNMLSKLSPGMGATVLMGRDPNLSSEDATQQYEFLTKNRDMIQRMLPTLSAKSANALAKSARCWKGYAPVPGKAPYSENSCRPSGGKKKKEKKAASDLFHHATKTREPVVNGQKPSTENTKHVKVVHHNPDGQGVDLKPEEAEMKPGTKSVAD